MVALIAGISGYIEVRKVLKIEPFDIFRGWTFERKEAQVRTLTKVCWGLAIGWVGVGIAAFLYAWLSKRRFGLFDKRKQQGKS
jgi:hypothetical protein